MIRIQIGRVIGVVRLPVAGPSVVITTAMLDNSSQVEGASPVASICALMIAGIDSRLALAIASLELSLLFVMLGYAIEPRVPMMAVVMTVSVSVRPLSLNVRF
jgi:hypothetical protein